jgi:tRNA A-37 threonylcarbamoyl transferase component Bud32
MNYTKAQKGPWTVWLANGFDRGRILEVVEFFRQGGATLDENLENSSVIWKIHEGGRAAIYGIELSGKKCCIKMFKDRRTWTQFRTFLGFSKGRRAFKNGLRAIDQNVPVPQVYAYVEKRPFGPAMVIMELLENAIQINLLIEDMLAQGTELTNDPCFLQIVDSFAMFTKDMHGKGVSHDDFSPRNVLVLKEGGDMNLKLIDLEDVVFTNKRKVFQSNIQHFDERMARYVDLASLSIFLKRFKEIYGDDLNR